MGKDKRTVSDQEREQRHAEQRELVRASIEQLRTSDGWQAYLRARRPVSELHVAYLEGQRLRRQGIRSPPSMTCHQRWRAGVLE